MDYEGLHESKGTDSYIDDPASQGDTKAGRFLSSRSAWDTARLDPGAVELAISRQVLPASVLNKGRQISEFFCKVKTFAMLKNVCLLSLKNQSTEVQRC